MSDTQRSSTPRHSSRVGRRGASSTARDDIAEAARELFGELGYDLASLRQIATRAGVDVALVSYFFGSKQRLFVEVIDLPFEPELVLPRVLGGDREGVGAALAIGHPRHPRDP